MSNVLIVIAGFFVQFEWSTCKYTAAFPVSAALDFVTGSENVEW